MTQSLHVVVFAGGDLGEVMPEDVPPHDFAIAADSGLHQALLLGIRVDLVIGDLDSVSKAELYEAEDMGAQVEKFKAEKNETDLELALDRAASLVPDVITVVGGDGGRFDHLMGNLLLLTAVKYAGIQVKALWGTSEITVVRGRRQLNGEVGSYVSLLPINGPASGITLSGLKYPLTDASLGAASVMGMSNEFVDSVAVVEVEEGVLVAIQPDALSPERPDEHDELVDPLLLENPGRMFN